MRKVHQRAPNCFLRATSINTLCSVFGNGERLAFLALACLVALCLGGQICFFNVTNLPNATGIKTKISQVKTIEALKNAKERTKFAVCN
jgi:hypothetical protein